MTIHYTYLSKKEKKSLFGNLSVTTKIILLNVFFFISFLVADALIGGQFIENYIAVSKENIFSNFYFWTFFTSMFMHGGIFHLFVNMLSLFFVGTLLEKIIGNKRYILFYLFSGLFAGLLHVFFEGVPAVGASGALFGLIGVLILLTPNLPVYMMFIPIPIKMKYAAPAMLVLLWVVSIGLNLPIGNIAHLGGLLSGLIYGMYLRKRYPNKVKLISKHFS
ncbi:MAG: rhomboid family intramembrane serine protease [Nanoarchaeota archaeon]|nr:rhomboid family intramembrane serine protease [Nanoarchaeota archaeon]